jgi:hypothetical protein
MKRRTLLMAAPLAVLAPCEIAEAMKSIRESDDVTILDLRGRSTIDDGESELLSSHLQELVANGARTCC